MADPESSDADILATLREMANSYDVDEVLAIMVRFDTPDLLG
jgi:hypothetical protein